MERGTFMSAGIGKRRHLTEAGFVVMWSSGFIGASLGTPEASTPTLMVWRFLLAAGLLLVGILLLRRRWPGLREIAVQGVVGLLAQGVYLTGVVGAVEFGVTAGTTAHHGLGLPDVRRARGSSRYCGARDLLWRRPVGERLGRCYQNVLMSPTLVKERGRPSGRSAGCPALVGWLD